MLPKFVRSPRDLGAGLVYLTLGGAAALVARGYPLGSAGGLGPGSLPLALGLLLVAMGVVSLLRCIALETEKIGHVAWRGLFLVTAAMLICALLLPVAGAIAALAALLLTSAAASRHFRLEPKMLVGAAALVGVCVLVFVVALGVPLPLFGG